jgi:hypothetical protein
VKKVNGPDAPTKNVMGELRKLMSGGLASSIPERMMEAGQMGLGKAQEDMNRINGLLPFETRSGLNIMEHHENPLVDINTMDSQVRLALASQVIGVQYASFQDLGEDVGKRQKQDRFHNSLNFTRTKVLADEISLDGLAYPALMWYCKTCNYMLEDTTLDLKSDQKAFLYKRYFEVLAMACKSADTFPYLLITEILNRANSCGVAGEYPEEFEKVLRIAVLRSGRPEFFDAFYKFKLERGERAEAYAFIYKNIGALVKTNIGVTDAFKELIYNGEGDGYKLRMVFGKESYLKRGKFMDKAAYCMRCVLMAGGDYTEAKKVLKEIKKHGNRLAMEINRRLRKEKDPARRDADEQGLRLAKDMPAHIEDAVNALIPPLVTRGYSGNDVEVEHFPGDRQNADTDLEDLRSRLVGKLRFTREAFETCAEGVTPSIELTKEAYADPGMRFGDFYEFLVTMFECFFNVPEHRDFEGYLNVLEAEGIPVPQEVMNVCIARVCERQFKAGNFESVIEWYGKLLQMQDMSVLRGTAYYVMKSYMALGPMSIREGLEVIFGCIKQFQDTEWEEELWRDYILPNYEMCRDLITNAGKVSLSVQEKLLREAVNKPDSPFALTHHLRLCGFLRGSAKQFPFDEYMAMLEVLAQDPNCPDLESLLPELHKGALAFLSSTNRFDEAIALIDRIPGADSDPFYITKKFNLLLNRATTNPSRIEAAEAMAEAHVDVLGDCEEKITNAKQACGVPTYFETSPVRFMEGLSARGKNILQVFGEDPVRQAFLTREMNRVNAIYKDLLVEIDVLESLNDFAGEEFEVKSDVLKKIGLKSFKFALRDSMIYVDLTFCIDENSQTHNEVQFVLDREFNLSSPSEYYSFLGLERRLYYLLFQTGLIEEMFNICLGQESDELDNVFNESSREWHSFRSKMNGVFDCQNGLFEPNDIRSFAQANLETLELLEESIGKERLELVPHYDVEFVGMISLYKELIAAFRDLDDPDTVYKSRIDPLNPIADAGAKCLTFFNSDIAANKLRKRGVSEPVLAALGLPKTVRNNFSGYAELDFNFLISGEGKHPLAKKKLSLVLDENGDLIIFGIPASHPLYRAIHCAVLESFALKVVPELGPVSRTFLGGRKKASTSHPILKGNRVLRFLSSMGDKKVPIARKKRKIICSMAMQGQEKAAQSLQDQLSVLQKVAAQFFDLELSNGDLRGLRAHHKDEQGIYRGIDNLFVNWHGGNYINVAALQSVPGFSLNIPDDIAVNVLGEKVVAVEDLPDDVSEFLRNQVLVKKMSVPPGAYRLPVSVKKPSHQIEEIDGEYWYLVPAGNKRGRTIMRDEQLYRLKEAPPFEPLEIGGETYMVSSWQRSAGNRAAYDECSTINIDFEPKNGLYSILVDTKTGKPISTTYIGPAVRDDKGAYIDKSSAMAEVFQDRGQIVAPLLDPRLRKKLQGVDMDSVEEFLTESMSSVGFRQGHFPSMGRYLSSPHSLAKLAISGILDSLKAQLSAEELEALEALLADDGETEEKESKPAEPQEKEKKKRRRKKGDLDPRATYKVDIDTGPYKGLSGRDLRVLDPLDPQYDHYADLFSLKDGEVLIQLTAKSEFGTKGLQTSKVLKNLLVKKK